VTDVAPGGARSLAATSAHRQPVPGIAAAHSTVYEKSQVNNVAENEW
jgi:hypothetical protein